MRALLESLTNVSLIIVLFDFTILQGICGPPKYILVPYLRYLYPTPLLSTRPSVPRPNSSSSSKSSPFSPYLITSISLEHLLTSSLSLRYIWFCLPFLPLNNNQLESLWKLDLCVCNPDILLGLAPTFPSDLITFFFNILVKMALASLLC